MLRGTYDRVSDDDREGVSRLSYMRPVSWVTEPAGSAGYLCGSRERHPLSLESAMSMFSPGRRSDSESIGAIRPAGQLSILAAGLRIVGDLDADGVVKIEGRLEGTVRGTSQIIVAPGGSVTGNISAGEVIVSGRVEGDITATGRIELQDGAVVAGDLAAPRIVVLEGGELNGRLRMQRARPAAPAVAEPLKKTA